MTRFGADLTQGRRMYLPPLGRVAARRGVDIVEHLAFVIAHHPSATVTVSADGEILAVIHGEEAALEARWDELHRLLGE